MVCVADEQPNWNILSISRPGDLNDVRVGTGYDLSAILALSAGIELLFGHFFAE